MSRRMVPSVRMAGVTLAQNAAAIEAALARGEEYKALVLKGNEMLPPADFARRLGVLRETVHAWRKSGAVLSLPDRGLDEY